MLGIAIITRYTEIFLSIFGQKVVSQAFFLKESVQRPSGEKPFLFFFRINRLFLFQKICIFALFSEPLQLAARKVGVGADYVFHRSAADYHKINLFARNGELNPRGMF